MDTIDEVLIALSRKRPIFHCEADFQHALAWVLQEANPGSPVRLELPVRSNGRTEHVDILLGSHKQRVAIELKYKTRAISCTHAGEEFHLANHSAQDTGRYDFIKDVQRLEHLVESRGATAGYAILLSNDSAYWARPRDPAPVDAAFRLTTGRTLTGTLGWDVRASAGTRRSREEHLTLNGRYTVSWNDYSRIDCPRYGIFKYVAARVEPPKEG